MNRFKEHTPFIIETALTFFNVPKPKRDAAVAKAMEIAKDKQGNAYATILGYRGKGRHKAEKTGRRRLPGGTPHIPFPSARDGSESYGLVQRLMVQSPLACGNTAPDQVGPSVSAKGLPRDMKSFNPAQR